MLVAQLVGITFSLIIDCEMVLVHNSDEKDGNSDLFEWYIGPRVAMTRSYSEILFQRWAKAETEK
jgi:hypothetical protein